MKVLFDITGTPFFLAHGGAQTQILKTADALRSLGIEVEFAKWWDPAQRADLIHVFSLPDRGYLQFAREKGMPVVNTTLFSQQCNRSNLRLSAQGAIISAISFLPPIPPISTIRGQFRWDTPAMCAANIVGLSAEVDVLTRTYHVDPARVHVIPLGLDSRFMEAGPGARGGNHLITTGTISMQKRSLELALWAKESGVPICFVGKPYDPKGSYWKKFEKHIDQQLVKHVDHTENIEEMIRLLQNSRGFVLASEYENWCLSAHEAAACGLPLLLPNLRWSRERFGDSASYLRLGNSQQNCNALRTFYDAAPTLAAPEILHHSWREVAELHVDVYGALLAKY